MGATRKLYRDMQGSTPSKSRESGTPFYAVGDRIAPHPAVPDVRGTVTEADTERVIITWDDGETDLIEQATRERTGLTVESRQR